MSAKNTAGYLWALQFAVLGSSTWTTVGYRKKLSLSQSAEKLDTSSAGDGGWKNNVAGQRSASFKFNHLWVPNDTGLAMLRTAFRSGQPLKFRVLDNAGMALGGALTSGTAYTSLTVNAVYETIPSGTKLRIGTNATHFDVVTAADANPGDTTITITSATPSSSFAVGALVAVGDSGTTPQAASGYSGTASIVQFDESIDLGEVFIDLSGEVQGALTDIG